MKRAICLRSCHKITARSGTEHSLEPMPLTVLHVHPACLCLLNCSCQTMSSAFFSSIQFQVAVRKMECQNNMTSFIKYIICILENVSLAMKLSLGIFVSKFHIEADSGGSQPAGSQKMYCHTMFTYFFL